MGGAAQVEETDEQPVAKIVYGPWGLVVTAQPEVGDISDLALAAELFDRVRKRRPSDGRDDLRHRLAELIVELGEEERAARTGQQPAGDAGRRAVGRE